MTQKKVIVDHARSEEQKGVLQRITEDGVCPFCMENITKYHKKPIHPHVWWYTTINQWPYENARLQILIIIKRHIRHVTELTDDEWFEFGYIVRQLCIKFEISSGAVCMRFGDPSETGASVNHLHAQIIVPDSTAKEPVRYKIGTSKT